MILPNIGAFIAGGLIASFFGASGWFPVAAFKNFVPISITYLLPLLIAFTGGKNVSGHRGGVVAAFATLGIIIGTGSSAIIGAMIMGPLAGWVIKKWDSLVRPRIKQGFEMLVDNFSSGIVAALLAICGLYIFGPLSTQLNSTLATATSNLINAHLIPLANIIIEPAKVLFMNNAINQGILNPIGSAQLAQHGKSILFLLETNPGPGLGVLLAFAFFGKGTAKGSAPGAILIHALGGVHEIYFPYVLMKPLLILAVIAGGVTGSFTFSMLNVGLTASPSPGSIISILLMTPRGFASFAGVIAGIVVATVVSFVIAAVILQSDPIRTVLTEDDQIVTPTKAREIVFTGTDGMGSPNMGKMVMCKKIGRIQGLNVSVRSTPIHRLHAQNDSIVVTRTDLVAMVQEKLPENPFIVGIDNFLNAPQYEEIINAILEKERLTNANISDNK